MYLMGVQIPPWKGAILRGKGAAHCKVYWLSVVSCARTAEPIEMPFGIWTRVGPRKHGLGKGADWRHLANATEPSMYGGDAACCQITLTTRFVCETVERIGLSLSHLRQLALSADSEQLKATINQLCDLLSPAAPGVFLPVCNMYGVTRFYSAADPSLNYFWRGVGPCLSTGWNILIPLSCQVVIMHVKWLLLWYLIDVLISNNFVSYLKCFSVVLFSNLWKDCF